MCNALQVSIICMCIEHSICNALYKSVISITIIVIIIIIIIIIILLSLFFKK